MSEQHLIPSYCEYINKYILQAGKRSKKEVPGEHHFIALYVLPRLTPFLGVPHYVNPDGMKSSAGDLVFNSYEVNKIACYVPAPRLKIEVKLENPRKGSTALTRLQYYHSIRHEWRPEERGDPELSDCPEQPDLFLSVSKHGIAVMPWSNFREIYVQQVYAKGLPDIPEGVRNAAPFPLSHLPWDEQTGFCFGYSKKNEEWAAVETGFLESLKNQCDAVTSGHEVKPLQIRMDL
jgi:hypothetical protein